MLIFIDALSVYELFDILHPVIFPVDNGALQYLFLGVLFATPKLIALFFVLLLIWFFLKQWTGGPVGCLLIIVVILYSFLALRAIAGT
jgi:hypothetical protein